MASNPCFVDIPKKQVDDPVTHTKTNSKKKFAIFSSSLILVTIILSLFVGSFLKQPQSRPIILRVDDIQDFAFREAQLFILNYSVQNNLSLSLAVIAGTFGEDTKILEALKLAVASGSEVGVHGWKHENLVNLTLPEQMNILFQAKNRIRELLNVDTTLLVPPLFSFNENTISAIHEESYNIISTYIDGHKPSFTSDIKTIPATVELSTFSNGIWKMKSVPSLVEEVEKSLELYGYAAIVTHPQEFISSGTINRATTESFGNLVENLGKTCQFTTFENLAHLLSN